MQSPMVKKHSNAVVAWLVMCLVMVGLMVVVGGYTRLSGSGLSITSWKPVHGVIPPLNEAQWNEEFAAYQSTPQYRLINNGMDVNGFKSIFWPEFWHRILGRLAGIVFIIPLLVFWVSGSISARFFLRLASIFAIGGVQGALGWIMVKSGLEQLPYVSPLRLAAHLAVAFIIFTLILFNIMAIKFAGHDCSGKNRSRVCLRLYWVIMLLLACQIIWGAVTAGSHAGMVYNTWPDMNGEFLPREIVMSFGNIPIMENIGFIQFIHRMLAVLIVILFLTWGVINRNFLYQSKMVFFTLIVLLLLTMQFMLGIATLVFQVPLVIALLHQFNALLLWGAAVLLYCRLKVNE